MIPVDDEIRILTAVQNNRVEHVFPVMMHDFR